MRHAAMLQLLMSLIRSLLFVTNFNILARIVPSGSLDAYLTTLWLAMISVSSMLMAQLMMNWVRLHLDSVLAERQEILRLSLVASLRPSFMTDCGLSRAMVLSGVVAGSARELQYIVLSALSALVIVPVLVLMFIRLPTVLFVSTVTLSIVASILNAVIGLRLQTNANESAVLASQASHRLLAMMANYARLKFYDRVEDEALHWRQRRINAIRSEYKSAVFGISGTTIHELLAGLIQMVAIIIVTFMAMRLDQQGAGSLKVADAFIMLHLIANTFQLTPRVADLVRRVGVIRLNLFSARAVIEEAETASNLSRPHITNPRVSVRCTQLSLPHGCRFAGGAMLDFTANDRAVVHVGGESGTGKTTFLRCLLGLEVPMGGTVRVFGTDPCIFSPFERARIFSYVHQDLRPLPGALRESLDPVATANDRDLWAALACVHLDEAVRNLPLGLGTPIADARRSLSTGERQRLFLAQAVLYRRPILVLDEAMSGLPVGLEETIFSNLRKRFDQIYCVSHRPQTRELADIRIELRSERDD